MTQQTETVTAPKKQRPPQSSSSGKAKRGFMGFRGSMKNIFSGSGSTGGKSIGADSNHTGGARTVATMDETEHGEPLHHSPGGATEKTSPLEHEDEHEISLTSPKPKKSKKKERKASGTTKAKRKVATDPPEDGVVETKNRNKKNELDVSIRSAQSAKTAETSTTRNTMKSTRSHDIHIIPEEEGGEVPLTQKRQRPRREPPGPAGTVPKFLRHHSIPKPKDPTEQDPATSTTTVVVPPESADTLEQRQKAAAYGIINILSNGGGAATNQQRGDQSPQETAKQNEAAGEEEEAYSYIEEEVMTIEEEIIVAEPVIGGGDFPQTPNSPTKKSILKMNELEVGAIPRTIADASPLNSPEGHFSLVLTRDFADDVTCLTMDDFEAKTNKPRGRVKRKGRLKGSTMPLYELDSSEHTSKSKLSCASNGLSDAGLAEILRKDIHSKKEPVLIAGLDAIQEFAAKGSKQRNKLCAFGAIPSILHIMENKKTTKNVLKSALGALEKVTAKSPANQGTACELGAIPAIVQAVQRHLADSELVLTACKTLELITSCMRLASIADDEEEAEDKYEDVSTNGAMTVLSCCLMTHSKDKDILAYAVGCITNICLDRPIQIQMLSESGGIVAMQSALKKKWKSKTRKAQSQTDMVRISQALAGGISEEEEEPTESEDTDESEDEEESHVRSFAS